MTTILLQVPGTVLQSLDTISYFDLVIQKGGIITLIIVMTLMYVIFVSVSKFIYLLNADRAPKELFDQVKFAISQNNRHQAMKICERHSSSIFGRILHKAVGTYFANQANPVEPTKNVLENYCQLETDKLEKGLEGLASVAAIAPMLGFLGTAAGMIVALMPLSLGAMDKQLLFEGIYSAMVSTVAGLIVGIITTGIYNFLISKLNAIVYKIKQTSFSFIELLHSSI